MTRSGVTLCPRNSSLSRKHRTLSVQICIRQTVRLTLKPGRVDYIIWRLMQGCVYIVHDTCPWHQRLDTAHQRYTGKHITKRRSCWSVGKAVVCMRESKGTSLWTSAKLKPALFRANTLHNRLLSETPTVYRGKHVVLHAFHCSYLKANKISKREEIRRVEYAYNFCRAMLCISAAYAVMRCPCVYLPVCPPVTFVHSVNMSNRILRLFSPSGSPTIRVFPYQTGWQ